MLLLRVIHCGYVTELEEEDRSRDDRNLLETEPGATTTYLDQDCHIFYSSRVVIGLVACSVLFLIFTCSMGCEQIDAISTGQGKIARMKTRNSSNRELERVTQEFNEMFGGETPQASWHWFNPYKPVTFPRNMRKVVLGYDWNDTWDGTRPFQEDEEDTSANDLNGLEEGNQLAPVLPKRELELPTRSSSDSSTDKRVVQRKTSPQSREVV